MTPNLDNAEISLLEWLTDKSPVVVAFSGGVDSALLAAAAVRVARRNRGPAPKALFSVGPTSSEEDVTIARRVAREIGVELVEIASNEMANPDFLRNEPDRCYHCKKTRFAEMKRLVREWDGGFILVDGENADDLAAYRPGHCAAAELGIQSPLAELGIDKRGIRLLAKKWDLSVADRPSTPCLVTRLAYGMTPTEENLRRIEAAERFLKEENFPVCRVRIDAPLTARIEVPVDEISRFGDSMLRSKTIQFFTELGFAFVSIDLEGFVSGKADRTSLKNREDLNKRRRL